MLGSCGVARMSAVWGGIDTRSGWVRDSGVPPLPHTLAPSHYTLNGSGYGKCYLDIVVFVLLCIMPGVLGGEW